MQETRVMVIAGPTASGKSAAAMEVAMAVSGEIICADSMQVYRDLNILSARPDDFDLSRVRHHLYGHVDGSERYSAGRFATEVKSVIADVRARRRVPILCGGTGLYLKAVIEGLSPIPEVPAEVVERLGAAWDQDPAAFRAQLLRQDPAMERLELADRQRHVRAASVLEVSGKPLSRWQATPPEPFVEGPFFAAALVPDRETLYERCDSRLEHMIRAGALGEVEALMQRGLADDLPVMKALGVREFSAHLQGEASLSEATEAAQQETRRFAKRQMTWFRNQVNWRRFETASALTAHLVEKAR